MSRKQKPPPKPPSKAYLVSFGDTMTALLAFFIVLNSLAQDQTGANLHKGTGSFVEAMKSIGVPGQKPGDRDGEVIRKKAQAPIYAVPSDKEKTPGDRNLGPDDENDAQRIIDRQSDNFQRFLSEMQYQFDVNENAPTESQIVFDSFEKIGADADAVLGPRAIELASDAINQLSNEKFELEIIIWANMPSEGALNRAMKYAIAVEKQIDQAFHFRRDQRQRLTVGAKPWLFVDAKRPRMSFVLSRMDK